MKRITLSLAALALMLVAADTASAQTIRVVSGTGFYPGYGYATPIYPSYGYPVYSTPVYSYPVYGYPSSSVFYSTPIGNSGRLSVGYGNGWGGGWSGYSFGNRNFGYSNYNTPWGGYSGVRVRIR